jgi:hypothetical protein
MRNSNISTNRKLEILNLLDYYASKLIDQNDKLENRLTFLRNLITSTDLTIEQEDSLSNVTSRRQTISLP